MGIDISCGNAFLFDDATTFRNERYSDPLTKENSGSAQYMLLLEEFYRSAVRLAGKPLLWLHLWVEDEKQYEAEVARLVAAGELNLNDWVDFGGLGNSQPVNILVQAYGSFIKVLIHLINR